jgi:glycosyltransferase 2 family protein
VSVVAQAGVRPDGAPLVDDRPPGDRYYRHPGDVVRLVVWGAATVVLIVWTWLATSTAAGVTTDLGRATGRVPVAVRELLLALAQVAAVVVPVAVAVVLAAQQRWRRLVLVAAAGAAGTAVFMIVDSRLDLAGGLPDAVDSGTWLASPNFPSLPFIAGLAAAAIVGKPWMSRPWRRATDLAMAILVAAVAIAGTLGVLELLLAVALGATVGAALLTLFGAPNRRPAPGAVASALQAAGLDVVDLTLERAEEGRSQLYTVAVAGGGTAFAKVYARDSRDADLLYRGYRMLLLRGPSDTWPSASLQEDVEHQAFLLLLARQGGVTCPSVELVTRLPDGSMALALEHISGRRLDELPPDAIDGGLLDALWREVQTLHRRRFAHRALRASNVLVAETGPVIVDFGFGEDSATPRMQAIDRAELLTSLAMLVGPEPAVAAAARVLGPADLATTLPYLQPLALSASTRRAASKSMLRDLRASVETATGVEAVPLERLVRVRPRALLMIAALVGAFYVLLPQLANVGDSFVALRSATWGWLVLAAVLSFLTYVAAACCTVGSVPEPLPFVPTVEAQMASSFVNRITPANVGGMALNVRFMQKAGVDPAEAVTGVGLNSLIGAVVHILLLIVFFTWAGRDSTAAFSVPADSKFLVIIALALAAAGVFIATRRGRKLMRTHVLTFLRRSWSSLKALAHSPVRLVALIGGSVAVTVVYVGALAASVAAFHGNTSFAEIGAVYLGASLIAAAAPTPGGLGALEAALVAGFTGVGMDSGVAVAAVLSYRLVTYWLPILPGWLSFHHLDRRGLI